MMSHKQSIFSDRRSLFFLVACLCLSLTLFIFYVLPALNDKNDLRLWADSTHYMDLAQSKLEGYEIESNFFSVTSILILLNNNLVFVVAFNLASLLAVYVTIVRHFNLNRIVFLFWLFINPMFTISLLTPNKEILAFVAVLNLNCFIKSKKYIYAIFAGLFGICARSQQFFVLILFIFLTSDLYFLKRRPGLTLVVFILLMSFSYPYISNYIIGEDINYAVGYYFETSSNSGLALALYELQNKGLFFITFIPKLMLNLIGNIPKIEDCFSLIKEDGKYDVYNTWITIGHQLCLLAMFITACASKKFKIDFSDKFTYYTCIHMIFFSITPFIQPRYIFPIYATFAIKIAEEYNSKGLSETKVVGTDPNIV